METERRKPLTLKEDGDKQELGDITLSEDETNSRNDFKANGTVELDSNEKDTSVSVKHNVPGVGSKGCESTDLNFEKAQVSSETLKKIKEIEDVLSGESIPTTKLQALAKSEGGLINDELRKKIWPKLLGVDTKTATAAPTQEELEAHEEYQQVVMDVNRSLKRFPPGIPYEQRVALQDQLTRLILRVIIKYPHLRYYQGYHDVAVTFLLVVGEADAFQIMERLSTDHLKDCMERTMDRTSYLLNYIYPLIRRMNPSLYEYIERADVGTMFCLAWFLTWYGHSLNRYSDVVRLYDYFLASPPLLPLYLAATLVVHRQDEIFAVECDMACIHDLLSKIPDDLPFELLLKQANSLYQQYPPESIEAEVKERFQKELQMRRAGPPRQNTGVLRPWNRFVPQWALTVPRIRYRVLLVTATLVGLYAYLRMADAVIVDDPLPVR